MIKKAIRYKKKTLRFNKLRIIKKEVIYENNYVVNGYIDNYFE